MRPGSKGPVTPLKLNDPAGAARASRAALSLAHVAWEAAPLRCLESSAGCEPYHRVRPILRWLRLAAEPDDQRPFLLPALSDALVQAGSRVLVSGAVDEAMAALVLEAGRAAGREPQITVLDRCPTPLAVNRAFAQANGAALETICADALGYQSDRPFNVVVTHSFLGSIAPADRPRLGKTWFDLLRNGGRAITVVRLRPAAEGRVFSGDAPERLAEEVRRRAAGAEPGIPADELAAAAMKYAQRRSPSFPVRALDEVVQFFEEAGFSVRLAQTTRMQGRIKGIEGPGLPRGGVYAEVVAERI